MANLHRLARGHAKRIVSDLAPDLRSALATDPYQALGVEVWVPRMPSIACEQHFDAWTQARRASSDYPLVPLPLDFLSLGVVNY